MTAMGDSVHKPTETQLQRALAELRRAREQIARYGEALIAIHRAILPQRPPDVPGLDLAVHFAEAEGAGGDFYDVLPLAPGIWAIVVADVSGHGLAATAVLALVHALSIALQGQDTPPTPGAALALVNRPLASRYLASSGQFVTAFIGWYEEETQVLRYASAGHPAPRLVRGGEVRRLDAVSGMPLGIDESTVYEEAVVQLQPDDNLVLFTDGITEGINAAHELFGDERLDEALRAPTHTAAELLRHILDPLCAFRSRTSWSDDETCLVCSVMPRISINSVQETACTIFRK